ncbi:hypothetical protein BCY86_08640 [Pajaroellobacter abortibovis]|uniref:Uncharacterized protein n=1 Tax=Pajaroellobacter abortibovis TaxID=1882918 RepID=A0A1L6MZ99_9BACT|nr:hypothetical protein BCY86_08640 [Pajaroellobacter abortibovis]
MRFPSKSLPDFCKAIHKLGFEVTLSILLFYQDSIFYKEYHCLLTFNAQGKGETSWIQIAHHMAHLAGTITIRFFRQKLDI